MKRLFLRFLLYFQPFIWMFLFNVKNRFMNKWVFRFELMFMSTMLFSVFIIQNNVSFEAILTHHIVAYALFVFASFSILNNVYDTRIAICLSYLIVYANSYYWEFMKHMNSILVGGLDINFFIQMLRLYPIPFLLMKFKFKDHDRIKRLVTYGLILSTINIILYNLIPVPIILKYHTNFWINYINRVFCLGILVIIFYEYGELKDDI